MNLDVDSARSNLEPLEPTLPEPEQTRETRGKQSQMMSAVLSPALRLWARSQLEQAADLHLQIEAGDRQLLSGTVPRLTVSAAAVVYRGLHFSQVELVGSQIQTNLRQVLRGKALRLLEAFPIAGQVLLSEADLNRSLQAPLLATAVTNFLLTLLAADLGAQAEDAPTEAQSLVLQDPQVKLGEGQLTLTASLRSISGKLTPIAIRTGLRVENGRELKLDRPHWLPHATARQGLPLSDLDGFTIDLGAQVGLEQLTLTAGQLVCCGQIWVTPD